MTERGAQLLNRGRRSAKSSHEAWEDIRARNDEVDWDLSGMIAARERQLEGSFISVERRSSPGVKTDRHSDDSDEQ